MTSAVEHTQPLLGEGLTEKAEKYKCKVKRVNRHLLSKELSLVVQQPLVIGLHLVSPFALFAQLVSAHRQLVVQFLDLVAKLRLIRVVHYPGRRKKTRLY